MKLNFLITAPSLLLITACASTEYFPANDLYKSELFINAGHFQTLQEPSLFKAAKKSADTEQYRLTVLSSKTPIHSIRVNVHDDGTGLTTVKVAEKGYLIAGRNVLESRKVRKTSLQGASELGKSFTELDFQNIYPNQNQVASIHPTMLCYEIARDGQYHIVCDSTVNITKVTGTLLPLFYRLGDVNSKSDWSLYEWFGLDEAE